MTQRIDELFGQALDKAVPETWTTLDPVQLSRLKNKFAELIVRECAMFVVTELEGKVGSLIADTTANRLEEHFGVEE